MITKKIIETALKGGWRSDANVIKVEVTKDGLVHLYDAKGNIDQWFWFVVVQSPAFLEALDRGI